MKVLPFSVELLDDNLGITCIENQTIGVLRYLKAPYQALFYKSHVKFYDVIKYFYNSRTSYSYYRGIERIQNISNSLNIIEVTRFQQSFELMLDNLMQLLEAGMPLLVGVNPEKLPKQGDILPWRNDHYICLYGLEENSVYFLDDIPRRTMKIPKNILKEAYQGEVVIFKLIDNFDKAMYYTKIVTQIDEIASLPHIDQYLNKLDEFIPKDMEELLLFRDAIGILRISRKRMHSWYEWMLAYYKHNETKSSEKESNDRLISSLDRLYSAVEFYRLRKKINTEALNDLLIDSIKLDYNWISCIKWKG